MTTEIQLVQDRLSAGIWQPIFGGLPPGHFEADNLGAFGVPLSSSVRDGVGGSALSAIRASGALQAAESLPNRPTSEAMSASSASITNSSPTPGPVPGAMSKKTGGGTATGGGINFQAAAIAIAGAQMLRGVPLRWLPVADVPAAVWAESEGAGDDVRLELSAGVIAEIQAKKGLARGGELWGALEGLVRAIQAGSLQYGALIVAPDSSGTVREDLPKDVERLGEGRSDNLTDIGAELHRRLQEIGGDWQQACQRLRVRVVHALNADDAGIGLAKECLRWVCADERQVDSAWNALYRDAVRLIETRGRWTTHQLLRLLHREGISICDAEFPAAISAKLAKWVAAKNCDFGLPASRKRLPLSALIEMDVVASSVDQPEAEDPASALSRYRGGAKADESRSTSFDALWTGRFKRLAVVVAGPGLGKSTLVKLLAHQYATDGFPVFSVALRSVAAAVDRGDSFDTALRRHALDGSGIKPELFEPAKIGDLVVLADGLDECGANHEAVAAALSAFSRGHSDVRIVVTTRPIGYTTSMLSAWTHYRLLAPKVSDGAWNLGGLLQATHGDEPVSWSGRAREELAASKAGDAISSSPHLLCMAAALIATKGHLPDTKPKLYGSLLALAENSADKRIELPVAAPIATRVLNAMGWQLVKTPIATAAQIAESIAQILAVPLGRTPLATMEIIDPVVRYWERLGVIEKLHHDGVAYWAFVHKTFGEYVAARHLADLHKDARTIEIRAHIDASGWHEVILFAAGLGLGDEILEVLMEPAASIGLDRLLHTLQFAANRDVSISQLSAQALVELSFQAMEAVDRTQALNIGECIASLAEVWPDSVREGANARLRSNNNPVQLTAWACEVTVNPERWSAEELVAVVDRFLPSLSTGTGLSLFGSLVLGSNRDRALLGRVALAGLALQGDVDCRTLAVRLLSNRGLQTQTFYDDVDALLQARGIPRVDPPWQRMAQTVSRGIRDASWHQETGKAWRAIAEAVSSGGDDSEAAATVEPVQRWFPQFGVLDTLIGFRDVPMSDLRSWSKRYDKVMMRDLIQAVVRASAIDACELAQEASAMAIAKKSDEDIGRLHVTLPRVDVPELDWKKAAQLVKDRSTLVAGMNQGSLLMAYVAGNMLAELDLTREEAAALLQDVRGAGLWGAVEIVRAEHPAVANELMLAALVDPLPDGAEHLFKGLTQGEVQADGALQGALRAGLASQQVEVACAAAELAKEVVDRKLVVDSAMVLSAYASWEERQPKKSIPFDPPSPLAALLETLAGLGAATNDVLLHALSSQRLDVREVAKTCVLRQLKLSASLRQEVVVRIAARSMNAGTVAEIFESEPPFQSEQIQTLAHLLQDDSPKWRLAGVELLRLVYLDQQSIDDHIARLSADVEQEIRRKVSRIKVSGCRSCA